MKFKFKYLLIILALFSSAFSCKKDKPETTEDDPEIIIGADLSLLPEVRQSGLVIKNLDNEPEDMLLTLKNAGVNTVRLRLWKNPASPVSGFASVKNLSQEIKNMGMKVYVTVHYSDSWADPGKQTKPAQWAQIGYNQLKDSVYQYTRRIALEISPDYISIGNEINHGLLWPEGNISNLNQMKELLAEGIRAVRENSPSTKIILHYAGHEGGNLFFSNLSTLDYDIIALSYYPFWHGKLLSSLKNNLINISGLQSKPVLIAETSYPFTFEWNDWTNNIIGDNSQILPQFPASPEGQHDYLTEILHIMSEIPKGLGYCYWGGEWISYNGPTATSGSTWENQALWDFNNRALPAIGVFGE